ncbi:GMC oxidoreductase [Tropicibacter naphthalenivorans]|uniref:6'''-hydroxyparomomycin C oxidase n=1 Tax=Tropicibacter naphthalenivorans TaxID=441103 RepID=A0A0N7M040_9RHOB|nr:GMC family oxidoreductase [Tropicibacter naphthalenivorans]CUH79401.1 6'''-hydroxyparomomycin C oxidase [Tropicibacter naphthalenivorans]SMC71936.1 Choline dehydrogenase [Tropicibacter naphthalenivorans]
MSLFDTHWDAIVIGTGMGGGTIGRALAEAGQKVLFVEQGPSGYRAEENGLSETFVPEARVARGLWPTPLHVTLDGVETAFYAALGAGVGGSSVFYAATLERPERHDLDELPDRAHPTGGWPVGFDQMAPWYAAAAQTYRVYGTPDPLGPEPIPLRDPPPLSDVESALMRSLTAAGLHPYHAHTGIERLPDCANCLGRKCPRACKMDGRSAGVEPALAAGAALLDNAQVTRLASNGDSIAHVEVRHDGQTRRLTATRYILAGGALGSPRLLLASANENWPNGLANRSGLVGRNLMFHVNEMFALWPPRGTKGLAATKAISLRDFYHAGGQRLGTVQAMGIRASYGEIVHYMNLMLARSRFGRVKGLSQLTRIPAALAHRLFGSAQIFVGLMEDMPYPENRVTYDPAQPDRLSVDYTIHDELRDRRAAFRRAIRKGFRGHRRVFLGLSPELNYGHPCGTLRFGSDPRASVLRPDCRAHDVDNLWVADASFMPTSMGVNPSLTIAANALRVADSIVKGAS